MEDRLGSFNIHLIGIPKGENIGITHFAKICVKPLHFYKRTTFVPVFTNWKKSEEDCHFYEKR